MATSKKPAAKAPAKPKLKTVEQVMKYFGVDEKTAQEILRAAVSSATKAFE